jgi:hypothetical protein
MPIAFGKRGDFSHPPLRLVPVEDHFVIIEAHVPSFYNEQIQQTQRAGNP